MFIFFNKRSYYYYYFFDPRKIYSRGSLKIEIYKIGSAQSGVGKLSCNKTALKRCTGTETLWNRKAPSLSSPEDEEIFLPKLPNNNIVVIHHVRLRGSTVFTECYSMGVMRVFYEN